jgi:dTDP-4-amino-4,6-dideoxygalactose transaminase
MHIPFNKPYLTGKETEYIKQAVRSGKISGNGDFTEKCHEFFERKYGFKKCLLTHSCTAALEMAAILLDIQPGDEVIVPSYTFVSTANAFVLRGAKIVFADSRTDHPGIDEERIEELITPRTKAIVPVHYAGVACDMDRIMAIAARHSLFVVEDAAQAIDGFYTGKDGIARPLGGIGHLAAFSFHETKNVISGEGGMLVVNDERFIKRAEIIWEKGTDRAAFFRGEVNKYGWVDVGSSFLPSEITAAFLWAQLEKLAAIQDKRRDIWQSYFHELTWSADPIARHLPFIPGYASNNYHLFYLVCRSLEQRTKLIGELKGKNILAVFHYLSLHKSPFYQARYAGRELPEADRYADCLVRLPFYFELPVEAIRLVCQIAAGVFRDK